ncbi:MAG: glycosyltransferase [Kiritimatiellae bacterium]|nr:glycosyltransferase [Kiritimatiellia bacterium]
MKTKKDVWPIISIVIANYNYVGSLGTAIKSVVEQEGFSQCELIVVDGGSTDGSVDIIKQFADKIAWWVSERDHGQSDAFNKGFAHAKGLLGCWVNADDVLLPGTLKSVIDQVSTNPDVEWITGGTVYFNNELNIIRARIGTGITDCMHKWVDPTVIGGPSSFFSLTRLRNVGGFNEALRFTMDCDLWNKFFAAGMHLVHQKRYFWGFRIHEGSKTSHAYFGGKAPAFLEEDSKIFRRKTYSRLGQFVRILRLKMYKLITGAVWRSLIDSRRFQGRNLFSVFSIVQE